LGERKERNITNASMVCRVAVITPPLSGHSVRGVGRYAAGIINTLKSSPTVDITVLEYTSDTAGYDVAFYPYFDPFFLTLPLKKPIPTVVTVHDLIPLNYPKDMPTGVRGFFKWQIQKISLRGVSRIITDSNASKKEILRWTGIESFRITVVYTGIDTKFFPESKASGNTSQNRSQYMLFVGDVNYNKNVPGLLLAYSMIKKDFPSLKLVLIGSGFTSSAPEAHIIRERIAFLGLTRDVSILGYVPEEELPGIYNKASMYVQPSFMEGFGLPILEAMASGVPVVSSNASSLLEIGGDACLYFDPHHVEEIVSAMRTVLMDVTLAASLRKRGLAHVRRYTWDRCGKSLLSVFKEIIGCTRH
jgi:glycosyltransferase involved in cell wall biosynthesis